jgi:hypothetical protein
LGEERIPGLCLERDKFYFVEPKWYYFSKELLFVKGPYEKKAVFVEDDALHSVWETYSTYWWAVFCGLELEEYIRERETIRKIVLRDGLEKEIRFYKEEAQKLWEKDSRPDCLRKNKGVNGFALFREFLSDAYEDISNFYSLSDVLRGYAPVTEKEVKEAERRCAVLIRLRVRQKAIEFFEEAGLLKEAEKEYKRMIKIAQDERIYHASASACENLSMFFQRNSSDIYRWSGLDKGCVTYLVCKGKLGVSDTLISPFQGDTKRKRGKIVLVGR